MTQISSMQYKPPSLEVRLMTRDLGFPFAAEKYGFSPFKGMHY